MTASAHDLASLADAVSACSLCPRLVEWRTAVGQDPPARYRDRPPGSVSAIDPAVDALATGRAIALDLPGGHFEAVPRHRTGGGPLASSRSVPLPCGRCACLIAICCVN